MRGKIIIIPLVIHFELSGKVFKRIKQMGGIEPFIILPMAALRLHVMSGRIGEDHFMPYPMLLQAFLKKGWFIPMCGKTVGEPCSIVGLDTFDCVGKCLYKVLHEQ